MLDVALVLSIGLQSGCVLAGVCWTRVLGDLTFTPQMEAFFERQISCFVPHFVFSHLRNKIGNSLPRAPH